MTKGQSDGRTDYPKAICPQHLRSRGHNKMICAPSEDSDLLELLCSLISRVFPWHLLVPRLLHADSEDSDQSLRWMHRSFCGFGHAPAQFLYFVFLTSSRECQMKDWPGHQLNCQTTRVKGTAASSSSHGQAVRSKYQTNDNSIFGDESSE